MVLDTDTEDSTTESARLKLSPRLLLILTTMEDMDTEDMV